MESPIRTPDQVAEHLARLRETRGQLIGAFERQHTLLEHQLAECQALRDKHASGERLPAGKGTLPVHITDVICRHVALSQQFARLRQSHEADLQELDRAIARCGRWNQDHLDGLDIIRLQEAEAALEISGHTEGPQARELLERVIVELALHVALPSGLGLTRVRWGLWPIGSAQGARRFEQKDYPYHQGISRDWELLIGLAPEHRLHTEDDAVAASVSWSLPVDACIYYLAQLARGTVRLLPSAPADGAPAIPVYDDPFQDE